MLLCSQQKEKAEEMENDEKGNEEESLIVEKCTTRIDTTTWKDTDNQREALEETYTQQENNEKYMDASINKIDT